jgi:hypothetical protein
MDNGQLPDEGPARLGPVALPAGRLITGYGGNHMAWATMAPVPDSGSIWAMLADLHPQTGVVPIQLDGLGGDTLHLDDLPTGALRPWDSAEFTEPEDPREADGLDVGALLRNEWRCWVPPPAQDSPEYMEMRAPFTLDFPGLAAPEQTPLTQVERQRALDSVLPEVRRAHGSTAAARIGLVAAERSADVLAVIGWGGLENHGDSVLPLTAVLRSWEDRFGARLIDVGYADLRLLVERPPRTLEAAQRIAAEHVVLADECIQGFRDVPNVAAHLVNAPIWTFWWD